MRRRLENLVAERSSKCEAVNWKQQTRVKYDSEHGDKHETVGDCP